MSELKLNKVKEQFKKFAVGTVQDLSDEELFKLKLQRD